MDTGFDKAGAQVEGKGRRGGGRPTVDVGKLFDKLPPSNINAERSLLGSIMLEPRLLTEVIPFVSKPDQFYTEAHAAVFKGLLDLYETHQSADIVQLAELLKGRDQLDRIGGPDFLMELAEAVPSTANAVHYARLVADSARLRKLIDASGQILHDAYHIGMSGPDAARGVIDQAEARIFEIAQADVGGEPETLKELLLAELERLQDADGSLVSGMPTGYTDLDKILSGLQDGEMLILAARPSMGKTAMALNIAEQCAFGGVDPWQPRSKAKPTPVGMFSLEMSRGSLVQRLISARSGIDAHDLRTGAVHADDWKRLKEACDELQDLPLYIDDTPGMTILQLRAKARRMKDRYGIELIVIDYLQLLTSPSAARESRQVEVSEISRQIKALARELKLPVLCLAQLNRGAEQREGNRPRMSDLRESGSIEQDADVIMLLYREAYYHRGEPSWDPKHVEFDEDNREKLNLTELIIAKQRNGPTGVVKLTWDSSITRFKNHEHHHHDDGFGGYQRESAPAPRGGGFAPPPFDAGGNAPGNDPFANAGNSGFGGGGGGGAFGNRPKSGPIDDHRDGGGPTEFDDDDLPPF